MDFLNNQYRKYLGLSLLEDKCTCKVFENKFRKYYVFFNKNKMIKIQKVQLSDDFIMFHELDVNYDTLDNEILIPKSSKGSNKKITCSIIDNLNGVGTYFYFNKEKGKEGHCIIGNYTTQKSFYWETIKEEIQSDSDFRNWLDNYVENTSKQDLEEIQEFSREKVKHIKYKEGDYFRVKFGRHEYGYGRILMDISKKRKEGIKYWDILMGKPLIIEMFHILTKDKNISISDLEQISTFPSQHIMDNNFYYGDYVIIGNGELPSKTQYPIMYGRSISALDSNKIIFQCGCIYKEMELKNNIIKKESSNIINDFINNSIGFNVNIDREVLEKVCKEKTNKAYWEYYKYKADSDLRSPQNKKYLFEVLKQFNLEELYKEYD